MDTTEGEGAFQDLLALEHLKPNTRNLDLGGGEHDDGTEYLAEHRIASQVLDPFMRTTSHNEKVIADVRSHPVDSVTTNSVLNVIDRAETRIEHITTAHDALKPGGIALFKVWPGIESNEGVWSATSFQSNRAAESYVAEVGSVFGEGNVSLNAEHKLIVATKSNSSGDAHIESTRANAERSPRLS